ncbi:MAG TPA: ABC transporter permease, partial [Pyrinomonadaceae bacterium]
MNARVVAAIARKDIVDAVRNRYLLFALLTPLMVAIALRLLQPGIDSLTRMTVVVHDPGKSKMISELRAAPRMNLIEAISAEAVPAKVEKNKATGGLALPATFDADIAAGKQPPLTIYLNQTNGAIRQAGFRQLVERMVMSLREQPPPVSAVWIDVGKAEERAAPGVFNLDQMLLPLLLLLNFAMAGALVVPLLLVEEKEKYTLDFLLTSPASQFEIIAGKALTGILYSALIAGLLLILNQRLIKNWPLTLLTVFLGLLLVVGVGLLMGALFKNSMQVNTWASGVLLLLMAPSFPSMGMPAAVESAARLIPTHYFVEALRLASAGTNSVRLWWHLAAVLGFTLLAFFAATW